MRRVVSGLYVSLDGVTESPERWQFDHFDEDLLAAMGSHIEKEDTILLGRITYQEWVNYWPQSSEEPYASHINSTPKYVVSTTLDRVEWGGWHNARLIKGHLADEINHLKGQPGQDIGVAGSPTLVNSLLQEGLLDELTLMLHPVLVGHGKRLFQDWKDLKRFELVDAKITRTGVAILTYWPGGTG